MTEPQAASLARLISKRIMTPGGESESVDSLKLFRGERYVSGWAEAPLADRIAEIIFEQTRSLVDNLKG